MAGIPGMKQQPWMDLSNVDLMRKNIQTRTVIFWKWKPSLNTSDLAAVSYSRGSLQTNSIVKPVSEPVPKSLFQKANHRQVHIIQYFIGCPEQGFWCLGSQTDNSWICLPYDAGYYFGGSLHSCISVPYKGQSNLKSEQGYSSTLLRIRIIKNKQVFW